MNSAGIEEEGGKTLGIALSKLFDLIHIYIYFNATDWYSCLKGNNSTLKILELSSNNLKTIGASLLIRGLTVIFLI